MKSPTTCPSGKQWSDYALGKVSDKVAEQLDAHLRQCSRCLQEIDQQVIDDPLSRVLQRPEMTQVNSDPALLSRLKKRIQVAVHSRSCSDATQIGSETPSMLSPNPAPASLKSDTHELLDFLSPPQQANELGRLGRYRIIKILGTGGMGMVFEAFDPRLERSVALKTLKPSLANASVLGKRLPKEAARAAAIKHDHVVTIYDVGQEGDIFYLSMELLAGRSLHQTLKEHKYLSIAESCRIGREIAEGLAAAHAGGVIHRDIKPSNVWLEGKKARVKILDFGLACKQDEEGSLHGALVGTPGYMPPEQANGEKVDGRADLFSLGCVIYLMITGELPFKGENTLSRLAAIAHSEPVALRKVNPSVPAELSKLVVQLLKKVPSDRPSVAQITETLTRIEQNLNASAPARESADVSNKTDKTAGSIDRELENGLWSSLVFATKDSFCDFDDLSKQYVLSVNQLEKANRESIAFFEMVCKTNLEFRSEGAVVNVAARDQVLQNELVPMMVHCFLPPLADNLNLAALTNFPLEHAEAKLGEDLQKKVRALVQNFLGVCEKLVDQQIVGLLEWVNSAACILHFFRKVVIQTNTIDKVVEGQKTVEVSGRAQTTTTQRTRDMEGAHEVRHVRHEHPLYHAEKVAIDRALNIPVSFQPLVNAIPAWLRPHCQLVTGRGVFGPPTETVIKKGSWQRTEQLAPKQEVRMLPPVRIQIDPAIVLGRYVFAGWGDAEMEQESRREEFEFGREQALRQAKSTLDFIARLAIFFIMIQAVASALLCTALQYSPLNSWAGLLVAGSGAWPVWAILRYGAKIRHIRNPRAYYFTGSAAGAACAGMILFLAVGFFKSSLGFGCLSVWCLAAFALLFRQAQLHSRS